MLSLHKTCKFEFEKSGKFYQQIASVYQKYLRVTYDRCVTTGSGLKLYVFEIFRITECENALYLKQKHNEMLSYLNQLEDRQFKQWCATVPGICKMHLAKSLIYRDPPFVRNNFSPEVSIFSLKNKYNYFTNLFYTKIIIVF